MEKLLITLAQAGQPASDGNAGNSAYTFIIPLVIVFFLMYWLMIRPQKKAEEKRRELIEALGKGDKIVTIGGICGTVTEIDGKFVTVKVDQSKNVEIKFLKEAVRGVERKKDGESTESSKEEVSKEEKKD